MSNLSTLLNQANAAAETSADMNEAVKGGGGGGRLIPEGYAFGRIVEYVELGLHREEFNGKQLDAALLFQIGFALYGEGYQNEDGSPYIIRPFSIRMSRNDNSKSYKLFGNLNWKRDKTHFAQLLGSAVLVKIVHVKKKQGDGVIARVDLEGFLPPLDPVTKAPYAIPEPADSLYRLFLWNNPTKEGWDSIFIGGTWDDGKSKNTLQEKCMLSLDFEGSALQQLLAGPAPALPELPASPAEGKKAKGAGPVAPAIPVVPALPA